MRTKTRYRQAFRDGGAVHDLTVPVDAALETPAPEVPPVPAELPPEPQAPAAQRQDDATLALKRQIEGLRQSEQALRQPMPVTREQRLEAWRAHGLTDAEIQFFQHHPEMLDHPELTNFAVHKAREAGFERGSEGIFVAVETIFNANMNPTQQAAEPTPMPPAPTPAFFKPPAPRSPNPASRYSAPVSRDIPNSGSGKRSTPGKVTLTPSEVEAARLSNISVEEYAKNKIEYERQKESGEYRDNRDQR